MESQKIIAIVNEKGGTCKTTTSVNLAASLGEAGKRVLLVDLDGQAASSRWLGVEEDNRLAEAMCRGKGLEPICDVLPGVSLAPASGRLDSVAHDLRPTQGGQLRKILGELTGFDFILIDCPPSLGNRLIGNALLAASHVLVPVETSILALDGLKILLTTLDDVREGFGHKIVLAGVLACRYDPRTRLSRLVLAELQRALPGKVFATVIRENVRMRECPASGKSILTFADDSHAAADYRALAKEIIESPQIWLDLPDTSAAAHTAMGEAVNSLRTNAAAAVRQAAGMDAASTEGAEGGASGGTPVRAVGSPIAEIPSELRMDNVAASDAPISRVAPPAPVASAAPVATIMDSQTPVPAPTTDSQPAAVLQAQPHEDLHEELTRLAQAQQHLLEEVQSGRDEDATITTPAQAADDSVAPTAAGQAPEVSPATAVPDIPAPPAMPAAKLRLVPPSRAAVPLYATAVAKNGPGSGQEAPRRDALRVGDSNEPAQFKPLGIAGAVTPHHALSFSPQMPPAAKGSAGSCPALAGMLAAPAGPSAASINEDRPATQGDGALQGEKKPDYPALREYMRQMAEQGRLPGGGAAKETQAKEPKLTAWRRLFQKGA